MKLVLVTGLGGAIGSTLAAVLSYGATPDTRLGMVTCSPKFTKIGLPLEDFDNLSIAGWDLDNLDLVEQVERHSCVPAAVLPKIAGQLKRVPLRKGLIPGETNIAEWFETELAWLDGLKREFEIDGVALVNLCPTGPAAPADSTSWCHINQLDWDNPSVTVSRLYFRLAIECGAHFINFTPNECEIEALTGLAQAGGLMFAGRDGKTGQTFLKTLIAPAFRDKNFRIDGWFSTNILGNPDGRTLADRSNASTKIASKRECLPEILGYNPGEDLGEYCHQVSIHYYPPRGDAKEAWDNIDFSGMFGRSMQLKLNWLGLDSILAAPAVLDLVRLTFLAEAAGQSGLLDAFGYFFKTPLSPPGKSRLHDVDLQYARLITWALEQKRRLQESAAKLVHDEEGWVKWPQTSQEATDNIQRILSGGTWAISGEARQDRTEEQEFCRRFADFVGMPHGVACTSGSTALAIAFEAAGVGYGDRVLVPPSPWVACASAVMAVGGIPVFCDLEANGLCMCPKQAEALLDPSVKAILLVHSHCAIADLSAFLTLSRKWGIPLIEDCSQAHGAAWQGCVAGSFGDFSVFSMQQSKVLTSGEGGVVLCRTADQYERLQQLRADGRAWTACQHPYGHHLEQRGEVQGFNYCLSELQSGLLLAGLGRLPGENQKRAENALRLNELLHGSDAHCHFRYDEDYQPAIYEYAVSLPLSSEEEVNALARRLTADLRAPVFAFDPPIYRSPLYQPRHCRRFPAEHVARLELGRTIRLPEVEWRTTTTLGFPHRLFLGEARSMERISDAIFRALS